MKNTQAFVTVLIPTLGRSSLRRAIDSLNYQTDKDWTGLVMFDGIKSPKSLNKKIQFFDCEKQSGAGSVRNQLLELFYKTKVIIPEWIAFLDDDDEFKNTYVEKLKIYSRKKVDVILFSYQKKNNIIPRPKATKLTCNNIGISYAVKTTFLLKHKILFTKYRAEDCTFLLECEKQGANVFITHDIQYMAPSTSHWHKPNKNHLYRNNIKFL